MVAFSRGIEKLNMAAPLTDSAEIKGYHLYSESRYAGGRRGIIRGGANSGRRPSGDSNRIVGRN